MLNLEIVTGRCYPAALYHPQPLATGLGDPTVRLSRPLLNTKTRRTNRKSCLQIFCKAKKQASQSVLTASKEASVAVKAIVTVQLTAGGVLTNLGLSRGLDDIADLLGRSILLELVSSEIDPKTGEEKETVKVYAHKLRREGDDVKYEGDFKVPEDFGVIGAVLVTNEHHKEMFLKDIILEQTVEESQVTIVCNSWVHAKSDTPEKRVFFSSKSYLPDETPQGLAKLRSKDLEIKRGNSKGERKAYERIYDYDTYNDLGDPDTNEDSARPVLGGTKEYQYPRRCRTGRPKTKKDPNSESRSSSVYVPRDEAFSEVKSLNFSAKTLGSALHAVVPAVSSAIVDPNLGFPYFAAIDALFNEGFELPESDGLAAVRTIIPRLVKGIVDNTRDVIRFEEPAFSDKDRFAWFRDEEFARQTLAGINPYTIELVKELPLKSKLDPTVYGPPESLITEELMNREIQGIMPVKEALEKKRLFMLDYHDLLLPYVHKVRELKGRTLYGSRTLFFLTPDGTLRPIAIELTRPASPTKPQWRRVFMPCWDATGAWLWKLAKLHVLAHDSGIHQLASHWLRTHCCVEPYIIATNRQLSEMHPIYRLLHPHFRYTMEINALAREALINANGIIESCFSPGKYAIELSSAFYGQKWRFDMEALPNDLIRRGMAVEDPKAEHGVRLTIEDYPFAADGLLIWSVTKEWVKDYVSYYYPSPDQVKNDKELQNFWTDVRTLGHADKKDEPWWPKLDSPNDLVQILTTMIWTASGHHAAVNFGQYHYGGYFPNRPTIARTNMPVEEESATKEDFKEFVTKPEETMLKCFPSQLQATKVMTILDVLSTHSPEEEYIGEEPETPWMADPVIAGAYEKFSAKLKDIDGIIDKRNGDMNLKNRCGAGILPYELLKPYSKPGVTGMGVPNSISI